MGVRAKQWETASKRHKVQQIMQKIHNYCQIGPTLLFGTFVQPWHILLVLWLERGGSMVQDGASFLRWALRDVDKLTRQLRILRSSLLPACDAAMILEG